MRRLLANSVGRRVLDPFVGSGTTLIEAVLAGRAGFGVDVNPLAVELTKLKATPWIPERRERLGEAARTVAAMATERVRASRRRSATPAAERHKSRYDDPRCYPPHVFPELVTLRESIDSLADEWSKNALRLVLSAIVVKVSLQRSDTDETIVERNVPRGAATRHFAAKAEELVVHMAELASRVPPSTPRPEVRLGDARALHHLAAGSIDLVITSPPYLGTYDYARHHIRRFGWVGLDPRPLQRGEIGSRRGASIEAWEKDVRAYVGEIARLLVPGGRAYLLVGDSAIGTVAIPGEEELRRAAVEKGLHVLATASQGRPDVYAPAQGQLMGGRREHLVALQRP